VYLSVSVRFTKFVELMWFSFVVFGVGCYFVIVMDFCFMFMYGPLSMPIRLPHFGHLIFSMRGIFIYVSCRF